MAVDFVHENIIAKDEAVGRVRDINAESISIQTIQTSEPPLATGISASTGVASGKIALTTEHAIELSKNSPVILVRETANPDDIQGIGVSLGILSVRGARTSHAAVVARQMGKVCIVSCGELKIDFTRRVCTFPGRNLYEGDYITLDGGNGQIYAGIVPVVVEKPLELIEELLQWRSDR
jgi:pyruvate,orthophosphate dikinase